MRVALVHDWLVSYRGGEKVLVALAELFPDAPIYTLFVDNSSLPHELAQRDIRAPHWLQGFKSIRKALLPLLPRCIEALPLEQFDLVISSSSCVAKGIIPAVHAKHVCYLHSPMRYIWDQRRHYLDGLPFGWLTRAFIHAASTSLRIWDITSSARVDRFLVNSHFVAQRVQRYYRRESVVVHPPIEQYFLDADLEINKEDYYLVAGALVPYKRVDLAIEACKQLGRRLVVVGDGPMLRRLKLAYQGPRVQFVGGVANPQQFLSYLSKAKALLYPGEEDFGLVPVEAMAVGTPVIAFGQGGAKDYIVEGRTGISFAQQSIEAVVDAIKRFEEHEFNSGQLRSFAQGFNKKHFQDNIIKQLGELGISVSRMSNE